MAPLKMRHGPMANYFVSEAKNMYRSRDAGTVVNTLASFLLSGTLLGRLTTGSAAAVAMPGNTGNPTVGTVTVGDAAMIGAYQIEFTGPTAYKVVRPDGVELATAGATGSAFSAGGLGFTVTAGATPAVAGDSFTLTVAQRVGDFVPLTLSGTNGSQTVAGILYEEVGPSATEERTISRRDCEVVGAHLVYPAGATATQIATANAALLALGIVVR